MKKIFIAAALIAVAYTNTNACEICGCGTGNYYIGLMPSFHSHFIGIRYQYRNFRTVLKDDNTQFSNDFYKTAELWGGINIGRKLQLIAIVPINFIHQVSDDGITDKNGLGDVAILANYKFMDKSTGTGRSKVNQQLWFGAGIKIPTGKFSADINDPMLVSIANTQTGTASTDFMLNAMYSVSVNKFGVSTNVSYKMNTSNKDKYSFGNKFSANSIAYYTLQKGKVNITPNAGMMYEVMAPNTLVSQKVEQTGGHLTAALLGTEISKGRFTIGGNVQLPVAQNFATGQTTAKARGMMHVTFSF